MPASKVFSYNGLAVRVDCVDAAQLAWLEEFVVPAFRPTEAVSADCAVTFEVDAQRYTSVLDSGPHPDRLRVAGFAFDGGPVEMPLWKSGAEERVVFDAGSEVFYCVNRAGTQVRIVSKSLRPSKRISMMRVVRELAMSDSWTSRRFVLHAGAAARNGSGILIAGPKGAGKTTLLMHVLRCRGAQFIANDRVVASFDQSPAVARGMPTVVSIRERTLRSFDGFEPRWLRSHYNERLTLQEAEAEGSGPLRTDPITLTPAQFCVLLGAPLAGQAPVGVILFPRLAGDIDGLRFEEVDAESARQRLAASVFATASPCKVSQLFAAPGHDSAPQSAIVERLCRELLGQVRCFDCRLGGPSGHSLEVVQSFLNRECPSLPAGRS